MKYPITNRRKQIVFAAFTALVFLFAAQSAALAQTAPRKYKAGDVIDVGNDTTLEIVECRVKPNTRNEEECDYIAFRGDSPSNIVTDSVFNIRRYEQLAAAEKKRLEVINRRANNKTQTKPPVEPTPEKIKPEDNNSSEEAELTVTAKQLYDEYYNNDIAAKRKYVGKMVRVTGAVVYTISDTRFSAKFNKIYSGSTIQCYVEDIEQLATLNLGETLTLVGVPLGSLTSTGVIFEPCRIERKTAVQPVKPAAVKTPVKTAGTANGKVVGTWYYTAIIGKDGTEQKLSNSESYLWLKEDGSYENRFGASYGQNGNYAAGASRLTLNREDGDKKAYTMTIAGTTMTLKHASGGYKLERE